MSEETMGVSNPPKDLWKVNQRLELDEPLNPDDERWVDTAAARGEFSFAELYRLLGVDPETWQLRGAHERAYFLFCGHRGCGKSTELRRVHQKLDHPDLFFAVFFDASDYPFLREVDSNSTVEHNSPRARFLLYNLLILEYNSYWWRSHPVVRTLPAYRESPEG